MGSITYVLVKLTHSLSEVVGEKPHFQASDDILHWPLKQIAFLPCKTYTLHHEKWRSPSIKGHFFTHWFWACVQFNSVPFRSHSFADSVPCVQNFYGKSKLLTRGDGPRERIFFPFAFGLWCVLLARLKISSHYMKWLSQAPLDIKNDDFANGT